MTGNTGWMIQHAWLVPLVPLLSFAVNGLVISPLNKRAAGVVGSLAILTAMACAYTIAWSYFTTYPAGQEHPILVPWSFEWSRYQPGLSVNVGVLVDPISVMLMCVVTTVSFLVHVYSNAYMHGEYGFGRYFTYLNLFTFSMLALVVSPNIIQMYVCWELVGVSSFLLIGYYYNKPSAVAASKKAFIVTRFADLGFLVGVLLLSYFGYQVYPAWSAETGAVANGLASVQPVDFAYLNDPVFLTKFSGLGLTLLGVNMLTVAMVLVYMGAAGKSAMFPLHIWLPDAMEGPTPVSALIHAATMVVAGVYLVARLFPAFAFGGTALLVVAYVGAFTSLFAAVIGMTQDDIKRVLAFSTLSQLGYMMLALGVSTNEHTMGYTASMFHLFTHAFFKALLFLGAGSVIHAVHSNSIWEMGGLAKKMPITHGTFLIATLAISGIWPFAGFFSKDEILGAALASGHLVIFGVCMLVAGLTAFYMFRIYFVTFWGKNRSHNASHAHEAPALMWMPMAFLAILSAVTGFVPMGEYVSLGEHEAHHGINMAIAIPATVVALLGISVAAFLYIGDGSRVNGLATALGVLYRTIKQKFYFDELYLFITHRIIFGRIARPVAWFDKRVVDGGVDASGWLTRQSGWLLSQTQTGQVQTYGLWFTGGVAFVVLMLWCALL